MQVINLPAGTGNIMKLCGEIDCYFSPRLRAALRVKLKEKHPLLFLDCSGVTFIDSCGMAVLIEYLRDARRFGGRLALVGLRPNLRAIFHIVHLDEHLPLYESMEEAEIACRNSGTVNS